MNRVHSNLAVVVASLASISGCTHTGRRIVTPPIELHAIPIQWGVGGNRTDTFGISDTQWTAIEQTMRDGHESPDAERRAIATTIAMIEQIAGRQTPTNADRRRGHNQLGDPGQMDCVDESSNTTRYLDLLAQHDLIVHHDVLDPVWRAKILVFNPHRTAVIEEHDTKENFVIDSWMWDNGMPPAVQPLSVWRRYIEPSPPEAHEIPNAPGSSSFET
ncbi:MAG: hypothetical protein IPK69_05460 [Phycisphaerales bacterium]|nr:MAG: hypothetical protein IPK69_05460 [Phycisphaerales bacterium]